MLEAFHTQAQGKGDDLVMAVDLEFYPFLAGGLLVLSWSSERT